MTDTNDILSKAYFNYQAVSIDNISFGDDYTNVDVDRVEDIYVIGQTEEMSLFKKYNLLKFSKGYIRIKEGLSFEVDNAKIKSIRLCDKYLLLTSCKTRKETEQELGIADYELIDGAMWGFDFVVDAKVLIYKKLKLYLHIDPKTDNLKEIRFGDIDEQDYC